MVAPLWHGSELRDADQLCRVNANRQNRHKPGKARRYRSIREKAAARGLK
jgi:hypothetical protein